jgi:hypothetical protein
MQVPTALEKIAKIRRFENNLNVISTFRSELELSDGVGQLWHGP